MGSEYLTPDPYFAAGGAAVGAVGGGLAGVVGGGIAGAGVGLVGGGATGAAIGSMFGPVGTVAGGLIGAGIGAVGGGIGGAGIGGAGGALAGGLGLGALSSLVFDTSDFREFPDELAVDPSSTDEPLMCSRPAFGLPEWFAELTNIEHWWLKHGELEFGLGSNDATSNPLDTTMRDQTGDSLEDGASCVPVSAMQPEHANIDLSRLDDFLKEGVLDFGNYALGGICKDAADEILDAADPDTQHELPVLGPPSLADVLPPLIPVEEPQQ